MRASASILIHKPVEQVFDYVANVEKMDEWVIGVSEPRRTSPGDYDAGSTFTSKYAYGGKTHVIDYETIEFDPPWRHAVRATRGPFPFEGAVDLEQTPGGTLVTNTIDAGPDGRATRIIFALAGPLLRRLMRKQLLRELEKLRERLEKA